MVSKDQLEIILQLVKNNSDYDFSEYAQSSLLRRVSRILINLKINYDQLIHRIVSDKAFVKDFIEDITVNTTDLFRDTQVWTFLRTNTMLDLSKRPTINVWIAGCSTGQEAYSIAMLLNEAGLLAKTRIFATDINDKVLAVAKKGEYRYRNNLDYISNFNKVISYNPLNYDENNRINTDKYFAIDKAKDKIIMHEFLRKKIVFMNTDLVKQPYLEFAKFDLISCRNVLIYHNQELQTKILNGFSNTLRDKSYLLLGIHESILGPCTLKFKKKGFLFVNQ